MIEIFNLNGMCLFFYINNIIRYIFEKDNFSLYASLFHITVCLFSILYIGTTNKIILSKTKIEFISNFMLRILAILSTVLFLIIQEINKLEFLFISMSTILYLITVIIWLIIHINFFRKQRRK